MSKMGDAEMFRRIFRPLTVITVVGFIISLILAPKPGVHTIKATPHITDVVVNSGKLTFMSIVFGTLSYAFLGVIIEFVYWLIKRGRMNADRSGRS